MLADSEFEIAICNVLKKFLPHKYGVCRGFVVDKMGKSAGDDIIIYDQELYPTLRIIDSKNEFAQKNKIPVEAVYAYIEAKNTLNSDTLKKAFKQVIEVKKLCYSRNCIPTIPSYNNKHIFNNEYSKRDGWNPIISNPVYGMIISANCIDESGTKANNAEKATKYLNNEINRSLVETIHKERFFCPDVVIAGQSTGAFCGHYLFDTNGQLSNNILNTRFFTGIEPYACYQVNTFENQAYGLATAHLMMALNYIKLGDMPWDMIFNTAKIPNKDIRDGILMNIEELSKSIYNNSSMK